MGYKDDEQRYQGRHECGTDGDNAPAPFQCGTADTAVILQVTGLMFT